MKILIVMLAVFLLNLPFGYWRANVRRFSLQWFLSVHLPVPFIIALRVFTGLGFKLTTFPVLIAAYFLGQLIGGRILLNYAKGSKGPVTSCLFLALFGKSKA